MKVSAPGNVILLGEYAVLEEGGLGVAFAVDKRVRLEVEPARSLSVHGIWPGGSFEWTPGCEEGNPIVSAAYEAVRSKCEVPAQRIQVDSSELYSRDGRKAGFGSSAAVTVALISAFRASGRLDRTTPRLALRAHRLAQGGTGSGYDVLCSYYGGWGLFQGGVKPSWEPHDPLVRIRVHLFPGPRPVSTQNAIQSFLQWKEKRTTAAARFIEESNSNAKAFLEAKSAREAEAAFRRARDTGIMIGDEIGVQARMPVPPGVDPELCKALGAGNELGIYLQVPGAPEPPPDSGLIHEQVSYGISWQP